MGISSRATGISPKGTGSLRVHDGDKRRSQRVINMSDILKGGQGGGKTQGEDQS